LPEEHLSLPPRPSAEDAAAAAGRAAHSIDIQPRLRDLAVADVLRWAALALAGAWAGYFLFTGMPQLTLHVFPRTLTMHIMIGAVALIYLAYLAVARRLPGGTPLDLPVLGLVAAYAIATWTSINWRGSLEPALQFGAAVIAFYALADLPSLSAAQLRRALMLAGLALSGYALWIVGNDYAGYLRLADKVEGLGFDNIFPATVPRVHDVSDHPNVLAMLLTLIMPFFALSAYRASPLWERVAGFAGLFVGGWAIFLTLSRGGWIGVVVGLAFTLAGAWITLRAWQREQSGQPLTWETFVPAGVSATALAAIGGALALIVFGTLAFLANASTRPGWLFRGSLSARQDAWHVGRQIFGDHPLTGAGPNTFGLLYPQYSKHAAQFVVHTQHAHNGFLQAADDLGLLGLFALAGLAAAVVFVLWRTWREGSLEQRLVAVACAGALLGFSLHNQLDAGNIWKAPGIALALVGAIIARNYRELPPVAGGGAPRPRLRVPAGRYGGLAVRASLLALVALPLAGWYRIDAAHYDYWQGLEKWNKGEPGAIEKLQAAVNADSSMMVYQLQLGQAQAAAYDATGRIDDRLLDAAIVHLERAVALDERSDLAHANLARVYQLAGRDNDAAAQAQLTRLAVYHVAPVLLAGEVYEDLGRDVDAVSTYGQVISMDAGLANSTFWQDTEFRRAHFDEILKASSIGINPCTLGAYLVEAHRYDPQVSLAGLDAAADGCKYLLFTGFADDLVLRTNLAKILMRQGDMDGAFGHLSYAVNRQPDFGLARTELGRWYAGRDDLDEARHQWVVGGQLEQGESVRLLGDSYPAGQVPAEVRDRLEDLLKTSGSSIQNDIVSVLYYRMRFGRLSPVAALVPGDWQDAVPRPYAEMRAALDRWDRESGRQAASRPR
jgi:O-antigen ligase/tetratricopeptide (TPR) repeat protein